MADTQPITEPISPLLETPQKILSENGVFELFTDLPEFTFQQHPVETFQGCRVTEVEMNQHLKLVSAKSPNLNLCFFTSEKADGKAIGTSVLGGAMAVNVLRVLNEQDMRRTIFVPIINNMRIDSVDMNGSRYSREVIRSPRIADIIFQTGSPRMGSLLFGVLDKIAAAEDFRKRATGLLTPPTKPKVQFFGSTQDMLRAVRASMTAQLDPTEH